MDHIFLADKLLDFQLPVDLVMILCCYLSNQSARVNWIIMKGPYKLIHYSVRQGSILSSFMLNFYVNEIINKNIFFANQV